jgi:hypothetical protein
MSGRRLAALAAGLVAAASACSGGGSAATSGPAASAPPSSTLPSSGTVTYTDGKVYTVAPLGSTLRLDDIAVKIDGIEWRRHVDLQLTPPGTKAFAVVRVTVTNNSKANQSIPLTQFWLLDARNHAYLASAKAHVAHPLVGAALGPGQSLTGTLVYPTPARETGNLLVYRFADARTIAHATHVGLVRYG